MALNRALCFRVYEFLDSNGPASLRKVAEGVDKKVTVQKVCRVCKNEKDVRVVLDEIWQEPSRAQEILDEVLDRNQQVFQFEKILAN